MDQQQLQDMLEKMGSVGVLLPAAACVAGLLLLLLGSKLARPMCAFSGLVLGGIGGLILGEALADAGGVVLALVIGTAIAGALLSALLFRVWMAISGALIFGLAAAGAVLLWQAPPQSVTNFTGQTQASDKTGSTDDEDGLKIDLPVDEITDQLRKTVADAVNGGGQAGESSELSAQITIDKQAAQKAWSVILDALRGMASYYRQTLGEWWAEAGTGARGTMLLVGLVAAAVGLLLGLVAPYRAASVQSAAAGAVLILFSSFSFLAQLMPEHLTWLPATPRGVLTCLGLITAVGLALQWTIFARKADK